uniref:Uncharacterized protein n=1 Tax=Ananas comosus var. bracteatus TaxID=296719 RepID=A0A6V7P383_ANACO|nr:unnamed protein product [Ananas comosus var. bracteatus]
MAMSLLRPPPPSSLNLHRPSPLSSSSSSSFSPYSHFPIHVAVSKPYLAPTTLPYALRPLSPLSPPHPLTLMLPLSYPPWDLPPPRLSSRGGASAATTSSSSISLLARYEYDSLVTRFNSSKNCDYWIGHWKGRFWAINFDAHGLRNCIFSRYDLMITRFGSSKFQIAAVFGSVVAISASWLFFSAIPTLLAFRKAAESLEKLLDVTAEELPDTMAAVRLSGMEISDLTMEISDLGHEITQGVRSSTRAVRVAEDRLRLLTNMAPVVSVQGKATLRNETETEIQGPMLARTARNLREGIVKGRAGFGVIFSIIQFSRWG